MSEETGRVEVDGGKWERREGREREVGKVGGGWRCKKRIEGGSVVGVWWE
jgi:hypothetical protein